MFASNCIAARTKLAAGRACRSTSAGSSTTVSELVDTPGSFRGFDDAIDRDSSRRGDSGSERPLDKRSVNQAHMAVGTTLQYVPRGQDRATQIGEHDCPTSAVRAPHRGANPILVGSQLARRTTSRCDDVHLVSGHLAGELSEAFGEGGAVRNKHDSDCLRRILWHLTVVYITEADSTMPNKKTQSPLAQQPKTGRTKGTIQSVDRAARILRALASGPRRLGVSELADRLGITRPTVHGLLQTLQSHGFVEQDPESEKYQLGPGLLHLGNSYLDLNELRSRSIVSAERLAERTSASVRVGVMHGPSVVVVHHVFRPDATFQVLEVGAELPIHASALGKAMLGYAPTALVNDLVAAGLPKLTGRTLAAKQLRAELKAARETGIARERDEAVLGESSLAGAIFDRSGAAVGAIGVVGETDVIMPRGPSKGLRAAVVDAARGISRELGARRWPGVTE
jgi:DNA-binding IclR family transcriptional regulator